MLQRLNFGISLDSLFNFDLIKYIAKTQKNNIDGISI